MRKNPERTRARRAEIVSAAKDLFFEYGYDTTSIRMIQERVGKQVAVFYYYFESKDEVFDYAIDMFLHDYEEALKTVIDTYVNPAADLVKILDYIQEQTRNFRSQYSETIHWSVASAIATRVMQMLKKQVRQVLEHYISAGKAVVGVMGLDETCCVLAYALGGSILNEDNESYARQRDDLLRLIPVMIKFHQE